MPIIQVLRFYRSAGQSKMAAIIIQCETCYITWLALCQCLQMGSAWKTVSLSVRALQKINQFIAFYS